MLKGNKISIRPVKKTDLEGLLEWLNNPDSHGEFLPFNLTSETKLQSQFSENGFISETSEQYLIVNPCDEIIGSIWAFKSVPYFDAIEVGYQIFKPQDRQQGYTTEALQIFHQYLFQTKRINRIELRIATDNKASEKVALKLGFVLEGTNREAAYSNGKLHDMNIYALLRREWLAAQNSH